METPPTAAAAAHPSHPASGWAFQMADEDEGSGVLVSPEFWLGGGLSLLMWSWVTVLAVQWL